ncbi:MAG: hypothetical protein ABF649_03380 [Bacillus sp. (in: firmicutes)]
MLHSKTRWITQNNNSEALISELADQLKITPLVASLLVNRGYRTAAEVQEFLYDENQDFHDPYLLLNMETAIERIRKAISKEEQILIFGDYDAGATRFLTEKVRH